MDFSIEKGVPRNEEMSWPSQNDTKTDDEFRYIMKESKSLFMVLPDKEFVKKAMNGHLKKLDMPSSNNTFEEWFATSLP